MTSFSLLSVMLVVALTSSSKADHPGLKVVQFKVPLHVKAGTDVTLECFFDMGVYELYTVKYYFNGDEFYRYTPKEDDVKMNYDTSPVVVNLDKSDMNKVVLSNVSQAFSGVYKCEVSSELPDFLSASAKANMTVTVIPDEKPTIEGFTGHYTLGHKVDLNCTGAPSIPPASLAWCINEKEAPEEFLVRYPVVNTSDGLKEARLGLKFTIHDKHYVDRVLKLKCTATIATLYTKSDEHSHEQHIQDPGNETPTEGGLRVKANAGSSLMVSFMIASFGLFTILLLL